MSNDPTPLSDQELIRRIIGKDESAFALLVKTHRPKLLAAALRMLNSNKDDAEDLIQQVFLDAYRHLHQFRQDSQLSTWLYSITLNRARNMLRHRKTQRTTSLEAFSAQEDGREAKQWASPEMSSMEILESSVNSSTLLQQVQKLSSLYREIITDHYFHGIPLQAIAEKTKRPINTIKVYLMRARQELAKQLKDFA